MATIPRRAGIYQIGCVPTEQVYVGRSVNLSTRWKDHVRALRLGKHPNIYLQQAWDRYDEEDFRFSILEIVDEAELVAAEQRWIDQTRCTDRVVGFNIGTNAAYPSGVDPHTWEGFVDPDGNEVTITNLEAFCREHGLSSSVMKHLAGGKRKNKGHKGWTHRNSVRQRDYIKTHAGFIDPDGNQVAPIINRAEFCRQHGLDKTHMTAIASGRIRASAR